jgi:hypothetical protein
MLVLYRVGSVGSRESRSHFAGVVARTKEMKKAAKAALSRGIQPDTRVRQVRDVMQESIGTYSTRPS